MAVRPAICAVFLAALAASFTASAQEAQPVRLAIIPGEGERAPSEAVIAQLEVLLTQEKDITLLERAEVKKILREQNLSASGLTDPAKAIQLGKLLSVEMFLFIERLPNSAPPACRVQTIEAQTGIVLAADMFVEKTLDQEASPLLELLSLALTKRGVPAKERRYVALLELRSEEPGRSLDGLTSAVGMLLTTDLGRSPNVIVLDRENLDRLTAEKALSDAELNLRTSSILISGGLRRSIERDKLSFTLELCPLGASSGQKISALVPSGDMLALRQMLVAAVLNGLGTKLSDLGISDPKTEAKTFAEQARMLALRGDYSAAVRAGEAAYALWPDEQTCMAAWTAWVARKRGYGDPRSFKKLDIEDQRHFLRAAIRQWDLAGEWYQRAHTPVTHFGPALDESDWISLMSISDDLNLLQEELRAAERKVRNMVLACCRDHYDNPEVQEAYWRIWNRQGNLLHIEEQGVDDLLIRNIREMAEAFADPPGPTLPQWQSSRMNPLGYIPQKMQMFNGSNPRSKDDAARARYVALWREFQRHRDPFVRIVGCQALLCMNDKDPETARLLLQTLITDMPPDHPYRTDRSDFTPLSHMVEWAVIALVAKEPDAALEYCRKIVEPWILAKNGTRLMSWNRITSHWLRLLESNEQYAEADNIAEQVMSIMSSGNLIIKSRQSEADQIAADLRTQRQKYTVKMGGAPPEDLWAKFDVKPIATGLKGEVQKSLVYGNRLFCIATEFDGKAYVFTFGAWKLPGGQPLHEPASLAMPCKEWQQYPVTSIACSGTKVYAGTPLGLLEYTPGENVRVIPEAEGVMGTEISALAWHDGRLYMGLGTAYRSKFGFASYDPATGEGVLIASSVAAEKKSPLDGVRYQLRAILSDPKHKCLWLSVNDSSELYGLWRYWPDTNKFELSVKCLGFPEQCVAWCEENILVRQGADWVLVDPDTLTQKWLMSWHAAPHANPPVGVTSLPVISDVGVGALWAWYDGEYLLTCGHGACWVRAPNKSASSSKEIFDVIGFYQTSEGLLTVNRHGKAFFINKK